jgi:hypothetical protein
LEQDFGKQTVSKGRRANSRGDNFAMGNALQQGGQAAPLPAELPPQGPQPGGGAVLNNAAGMGGQADPLADGQRVRNDAAERRSGLSLPVEIPEVGQRRTFQRSEGAPRLALSFRNRESTERVWKLLWAGLWLAEGALLCWLLVGGGSGSLWQRLAWGLISLGVVWVLVCAASAWGLIPLVLGLGLRSVAKENKPAGDPLEATGRQ